jgi:prepilin-type N-terminal cleavage/methylation domain-containing protein/prepilin-type processing-associated H-X9-DG protein
MKQHASSHARAGGFSIVELLVVIAIISILTALMLPALSRSRDTAQELRCMGNMRQYFTYSEAFKADRKAIMPNGYFASHPDGFIWNGGTTVAQNEGRPDSIDQYAPSHLMLANMGYVPTFGRLLGTSSNPTFTRAAFLDVIAKTKNTIFSCPSMYTGHTDGAWGTRTGTSRIVDISDRNAAAWGRHIGWDTNAQQYNWSLSAYHVNIQAGVHSDINTYGYNAWKQFRTNGGYYKRREWRNEPSRIGYIFESNWPYPGASWTYLDSITTNSLSYGGYNPDARHNARSSTNLMYADGHAIKFARPSYLNVAQIANGTPENPVGILFY